MARQYNKPPVDVQYKKRKTLSLNKAVNSVDDARQQTTQGLRLGEVGSSGLSMIESYVNLMMPYELSWPRILDTFEEMQKDDAVSVVLRLDQTLVQKACSGYKIKHNKKSTKSVKAAELFRNNIENLEGQTFEDVVTHAASIDKNGFALLEKVFKRTQQSKDFGDFRILKLANRPVKSLSTSEPFTYVNQGRRLKSFNQDPNYFKNSNHGLPSYYPFNVVDKGVVPLKRNKVLLFGFGASDDTPFGKSPLVGIYKAWKEKVLLEDLEVVGTTKDLAGILELKIPADIINKAAADPTSPEAISLDAFKRNAANAHAGEASYIIIPSDVEGTNPLYSMNLKGIDGSL